MKCARHGERLIFWRDWPEVIELERTAALGAWNLPFRTRPHCGQ